MRLGSDSEKQDKFLVCKDIKRLITDFLYPSSRTFEELNSLYDLLIQKLNTFCSTVAMHYPNDFSNFDRSLKVHLDTYKNRLANFQPETPMDVTRSRPMYQVYLDFLLEILNEDGSEELNPIALLLTPEDQLHTNINTTVSKERLVEIIYYKHGRKFYRENVEAILLYLEMLVKKLVQIFKNHRPELIELIHKASSRYKSSREHPRNLVMYCLLRITLNILNEENMSAFDNYLGSRDVVISEGLKYKSRVDES